MLKRAKLGWQNYLSMGLIGLGILGLIGIVPIISKMLWLCIGLIVAGVLLDLSMAGRLRKKAS